MVALSEFTFQSGSILMIPVSSIEESSIFIYIPIWFYSNLRQHLIQIQRLLFTFQSGSILIRYTMVMG